MKEPRVKMDGRQTRSRAIHQKLHLTANFGKLWLGKHVQVCYQFRLKFPNCIAIRLLRETYELYKFT